MVLLSTGAGAFRIVHTIVPAPVEAVPVTATVQLLVVALPAGATLATVGAVPWLITSSYGTFIAEISARPAVTFARA